jgi:hypothetical protein
MRKLTPKQTMTTFQDRIEALLQELPDTDALEESRLKKAARHKINYPYSRAADPNTPIDDTLLNVVDAMRNMFGYDKSLSDYDDRGEHPLPPYYGELADALIHTDLVWTIFDEIACDGLTLLFVNHHGVRLTRWGDDLRRLNPPLSKCYDEAYALLFDLLGKAADLPGSTVNGELNLEALLTDELSRRIEAVEERIEKHRDRSFLKIARQYRDAIEPFL